MRNIPEKRCFYVSFLILLVGNHVPLWFFRIRVCCEQTLGSCYCQKATILEPTTGSGSLPPSWAYTMSNIPFPIPASCAEKYGIRVLMFSLYNFKLISLYIFNISLRKWRSHLLLYNKPFTKHKIKTVVLRDTWWWFENSIDLSVRWSFCRRNAQL